MKKVVKTVLEGVGLVAVIALWGLVAWMFLASTPPQASAEAEALAEIGK